MGNSKLILQEDRNIHWELQEHCMAQIWGSKRTHWEYAWLEPCYQIFLNKLFRLRWVETKSLVHNDVKWDNNNLKKMIQNYHNINLKLATKARACEGEGQEGSPGVTFHAPGSARECEGINSHTPKWAPTLGVGVPVDSQIFRKQLQGSKPIGLKSFLYHWKDLGT